jgi:hypothetical protein
MKLTIALLVGLFSTSAALAFDAAELDMPLLIHGAEQSSGTGCPAIRALKPVELPQPWRAVVTRIVTSCEPMEGKDKEPDASTSTVASLRAGAVTLRGVPVVELRHGESWAHGDSQYLLDAPYAGVVETLLVYAKARCMAILGAEAKPDSCAISDDAANGGRMVRTSELGGIRVYPDAEDAQRSIVADAWSE